MKENEWSAMIAGKLRRALDALAVETLRRITDLSVTDARVKYISFSRNIGKEAAMLAGMEYAVKHDYICIIDADLQHSPSIIPQMLDYVENQGYDVAASRRAAAHPPDDGIRAGGAQRQLNS